MQDIIIIILRIQSRKVPVKVPIKYLGIQYATSVFFTKQFRIVIITATIVENTTILITASVNIVNSPPF